MWQIKYPRRKVTTRIRNRVYLKSDFVDIDSSGKSVKNKKVLLRGRKRHTARHVTSACYAGGMYPIQSWWGVSHPVMVGGYPQPPSRPGWEVPQVPPPPLSRPGQGGTLGTTIQTWPGGVPQVPPHHPDLEWGTPPHHQTWDGVPPLHTIRPGMGYPPHTIRPGMGYPPPTIRPGMGYSPPHHQT